MDEHSQRVAVEVQDATAIVRFIRPRERNPLTSATLTALERAIDQTSDSSQLKAIIFTGSEDVFLSGANIRELAQLDESMAADFSRRGQAIMQKIADSKLVTIAAINGYCMGGGLDLALACDIRIAAPTAVFAHPGARLGIITGWGGTQRLPRLIGKLPALELFATARRFDSNEAMRLGLITAIFTDVLAAAGSLAEAISSRSAQSPVDSHR